MRGKQFTDAELDVIRIGLQNGQSTTTIAAFLGRAPRSIRKRIDRMRQDGSINQQIMDLGQIDGGQVDEQQ